MACFRFFRIEAKQQKSEAKQTGKKRNEAKKLKWNEKESKIALPRKIRSKNKREISKMKRQNRRETKKNRKIAQRCC
jgi:hypothetical protein